MRFLLTLSISLFFLLCKTHAHVYEHGAVVISATSPVNKVHASLNAYEKSLLITGTPFLHKSRKYKIPDFEFEEYNEDDEFGSSRKFSALPNQSFICFYAQGPPPFIFSFTNNLPVCTHLSYSASNTYLLHRQLRI